MMNTLARITTRGFAVFALPLIVLMVSCISSGKKGENNATGTIDEFVPLFDGKTLNGWGGDLAYWRIEDGILIGETTVSTPPLKANTFLIWKGDSPADFELITDFRISSDGNSGINYRSEMVEDVPYALKGYQADIDGRNNYTGQNYEERNRTTLGYRGEIVQIPTSEASKVERNVWTGRAIVGSLGSADSLKMLINAEGWNECRLVISGNRLQHYINGILMSDVTDDDANNAKRSGRLGIQIHTGPPMKVEYKNMRIKHL